MANVLKHRFASGKTDGADASQIQPSHWNDGHAFTGGNAGDVLTRALTDANYGAIWTPAGSVRTLSSTDTGTLNDWIPAGLDGRSCTVIWTGTANAAVTGIGLGATDGQTVTIKNHGSGIVRFYSFHASSAAANRLLTVATTGSTPIGAEGWIAFTWSIYYGCWIMTAHEQGAWIVEPFNAGNYYISPSGAWTMAPGNAVERWRLTGRTLHWHIYLTNTNLAAAGGPHRVIFEGYQVNPSVFFSTQIAFADSTGTGTGYVQHAAPNVIDFFKDIYGSTYPAGVLYVSGSGFVQVL